jgi:hypothetical protein
MAFNLTTSKEQGLKDSQRQTLEDFWSHGNATCKIMPDPQAPVILEDSPCHFTFIRKQGKLYWERKEGRGEAG